MHDLLDYAGPFPMAEEQQSSPDLVTNYQSILTRVRVVADDLDEIFASIDDGQEGHWKVWRLGPYFGYDDNSTFLWANTTYGRTFQSMNPERTPGFEEGTVYGPSTNFTIGTYGVHVDASGNVDGPPRWILLLRVYDRKEMVGLANSLHASTLGQIIAYEGNIYVDIKRNSKSEKEGATEIEIDVEEPSSRFKYKMKATCPTDTVPLTFTVRDPFPGGSRPTSSMAHLDRTASFSRVFYWSDRFQDQVYDDNVPNFEFNFHRSHELYLSPDWSVRTLPDYPWLQYRHNLVGYIRYIDP